MRKYGGSFGGRRKPNTGVLFVSMFPLVLGVIMFITGITGVAAMPKTAMIIGFVYTSVGAWGLGLYTAGISRSIREANKENP
jgi:hypothetical protein